MGRRLVETGLDCIIRVAKPFLLNPETLILMTLNWHRVENFHLAFDDGIVPG